MPTATTIPEPATTPEPQPPDLKEAARPKAGTAGPVTAHPVPALPKAATPVPEAAPRKTTKQPDGAADGARIVPAKPLAPMPHPEAGAIAKPPPDMTARASGGAGSGGSAETPQEDEYAAAAERWRSRMAGGMGGMAGAAHQQGTVGDGSNATGGGGTVVGFEFLSYRQRIFALIKRNWANAVRRAGLVAKVRFALEPDGAVSGVELVSSSGDRNYDQSVVRAVQRSSPLPPPPERYRDEFREVVIDFYSEEEGGQGAG
jgi:TonB family protein